MSTSRERRAFENPKPPSVVRRGKSGLLQASSSRLSGSSRSVLSQPQGSLASFLCLGCSFEGFSPLLPTCSPPYQVSRGRCTRESAQGRHGGDAGQPGLQVRGTWVRTDRAAPDTPSPEGWRGHQGEGEYVRGKKHLSSLSTQTRVRRKEGWMGLGWLSS